MTGGPRSEVPNAKKPKEQSPRSLRDNIVGSFQVTDLLSLHLSIEMALDLGPLSINLIIKISSSTKRLTMARTSSMA